ncbi:helix-turn-helix domain-containing protein [Actinomadura rubrisoli]|uniref:XRE family transcriptional regulator n=1 Tax=Actinomadura rubrisoli TaxID=2530368 RepID=A0A4V2YZB0_9ACTN|nr:XRE family transcriptional regulator [Actinomadura rubrisoli]TDD96327.1 XRE family transcriptional regulator [Actinomadura rubrisoli]
MDQLQALAENIRALRATHGLSLSQLAERSGIAKATLFKISRCQTNPTLDTLTAIADTFDVTVIDLLTMAPSPAVDVVRPGEGLDLSDDLAKGEILRSQVIGAGTLEIHSQTFQAGGSEVSHSHGAGTREHVLVHTGTIRLGPVGHEVEATAGDYVTYLADCPHRWQAVGDDSHVWIVHTYPRAAAFLDG